MHRPLHLLSVCFSAGVLGALLSGVLLWLAGRAGLFDLAGVSLAPSWQAVWLYQRLLWGGLWGLVYFLAIGPSPPRGRWIRRGMWVSILPTAFQLLVVFPSWQGVGMLGSQLGRLTPLVVLTANLVWGLLTGICCRLLWGRR